MTHAKPVLLALSVFVINVNYFCRSAPAIFAGRDQGDERAGDRGVPGVVIRRGRSHPYDSDSRRRTRRARWRVAQRHRSGAAG